MLNFFDMSWVMPNNVEDPFLQWRLRSKFVRGNILWKLVAYTTVWKLWLERNRRVFINKSRSVEELVESIVWTVSQWVCNSKDFIGISLEDLNRSWTAVFKRGWLSRIVHRTVWNHPPPSILKLNFDGSLVQSVQRGVLAASSEIGMESLLETFLGRWTLLMLMKQRCLLF